MKLGKILFIAAIALFFGTVVWALFKQVKCEGCSDLKSQTPTELGADFAFFPAQSTVWVKIDAPMDVVLDPSFAGVKLVGDTAILKYLQIQTDALSPKFQGIEVVCKNAVGQFGRQSAEWISLEKSETTIVLGTSSMDVHNTTNMTFWHCRSIRTKSTLTGRNTKLMMSRCGPTQLDLNFRQLHIDASGTPVDSISQATSFTMKGSCQRLFVKNLSNMHFDAEQFECKELYGQEIFVSKVAFASPQLARLNCFSLSPFSFVNDPKYFLDETDVCFRHF